jgi:curved DNA-binding protein CbpA
MAAADRGGPGPDHYQLLGVARGASREEIAQAWRRRAQAEHPDRWPGEAGEAAARFRALAEAYRVLGDPGRRAAYDRALAPGQAAVRRTSAAGMPPGVPVPVRVIRPDSPAGAAPKPEPPLRAGPVRVESPRPAPPGDGAEEDIRLAVLAELALRYLTRDFQGRSQPW